MDGDVTGCSSLDIETDRRLEALGRTGGRVGYLVDPVFPSGGVVRGCYEGENHSRAITRKMVVPARTLPNKVPLILDTPARRRR